MWVWFLKKDSYVVTKIKVTTYLANDLRIKI